MFELPIDVLMQFSSYTHLYVHRHTIQFLTIGLMFPFSATVLEKCIYLYNYSLSIKTRQKVILKWRLTDLNSVFSYNTTSHINV